jgi:hypothetical protein
MPDDVSEAYRDRRQRATNGMIPIVRLSEAPFPAQVTKKRVNSRFGGLLRLWLVLATEDLGARVVRNLRKRSDFYKRPLDVRALVPRAANTPGHVKMEPELPASSYYPVGGFA